MQAFSKSERAPQGMLFLCEVAEAVFHDDDSAINDETKIYGA
jgi:hypothetical protein